jgi:hypothetical protein
MFHTFSADVKLGHLTQGKAQIETVSERRAEVTVLPQRGHVTQGWKNFRFHVILIFRNALYQILY